jgi:hypothetical protein
MTELTHKNSRRFGVEIEVNTTSGYVKKLDKEDTAEGANEIAWLPKMKPPGSWPMSIMEKGKNTKTS